MDFMTKEYIERKYRKLMKTDDLVGFPVKIQESDLFVLADKNLEKETLKILSFYRQQLEDYISRDPLFKISLTPYTVKEDAPLIVKQMAYWAGKAGVGPMASVAGAISEFVGKELLNYSSQIIIENGGDIFISTKKERRVLVFAGDSPWSNKIGILIPKNSVLGICTSSGTVGPSLSFGKADAVVIISDSAVFADAMATAVGNLIQKPEDINIGLEFAKKFPEIHQVIIIIGEHLGVWGKYELIDV
jgi:ApbE superfamily uncharacterized protein (UPF0280 family)